MEVVDMKFEKQDVCKIVSNILRVDSSLVMGLDEDYELEKVGMTSVNAVQLFAGLESKYDIEFEDNDISLRKINTLGKVFALLERY